MKHLENNWLPFMFFFHIFNIFESTLSHGYYPIQYYVYLNLYAWIVFKQTDRVKLDI